MKIHLEGDPDEIAKFFALFQTSQNMGTSALSYVSAPAAPTPAVIPEAQREEFFAPPEEAQAQAEERQAILDGRQTIIEANRRPAIKDKITQFLEARGKPAQIGEIAKATGLARAKLTARLAELASDGFVSRFRTEPHEPYSYEFLKLWSPMSATERQKRAIAAGKARAPKTTKPEARQDEPLKVEPVKVAPEAPAAQVAPVAADPAPEIPGGTQKERILNFINAYGRTTATEISEYLGVPNETVKSRLSELTRGGAINRIEPVPPSKAAFYEPINAPTSPKGEQPAQADVPAQEAQPVQQQDQQQQQQDQQQQQSVEEPGVEQGDVFLPHHAELLRIMGVLADGNHTYYDLERITGIPRNILSTRLLWLERRGLVERTGGRRGGPVVFEAIPPKRKNELPPHFNSLSEAVTECVKQNPGASSKQIAIRLMKSWGDVSRRLADLERTVIVCRPDHTGERFYLR